MDPTSPIPQSPSGRPPQPRPKVDSNLLEEASLSICRHYRAALEYVDRNELEGALIHLTCALNGVLIFATQYTGLPRPDEKAYPELIDVYTKLSLDDLQRTRRHIATYIIPLQDELKKQKYDRMVAAQLGADSGSGTSAPTNAGMGMVDQKNSQDQDDDRDDEDGPLKLQTKPVVVDTSLTFKDLPGQEIAQKQINTDVCNPQFFKRLFVTPTKGILLYGPPGTGKTMIAKATAGEMLARSMLYSGTSDNGLQTILKVVFFAPKGSDLKGKFHGDTEKKISKAFSDAAHYATKCEKILNTRYKDKYSVVVLPILFIDEVEALVASRDQDANSGNSVNQFLQEMDGLESKGVLVIAATNLPWKIDSAILRRFNTQVYVKLPSASAIVSQIRLEIVKYIQAALRVTSKKKSNASKAKATVSAEELPYCNLDDLTTAIETRSRLDTQTIYSYFVRNHMPDPNFDASLVNFATGLASRLYSNGDVNNVCGYVFKKMGNDALESNFKRSFIQDPYTLSDVVRDDCTSEPYQFYVVDENGSESMTTLLSSKVMASIADQSRDSTPCRYLALFKDTSSIAYLDDDGAPRAAKKTATGANGNGTEFTAEQVSKWKSMWKWMHHPEFFDYSLARLLLWNHRLYVPGMPEPDILILLPELGRVDKSRELAQQLSSVVGTAMTMSGIESILKRLFIKAMGWIGANLTGKLDYTKCTYISLVDIVKKILLSPDVQASVAATSAGARPKLLKAASIPFYVSTQLQLSEAQHSIYGFKGNVLIEYDWKLELTDSTPSLSSVDNQQTTNTTTTVAAETGIAYYMSYVNPLSYYESFKRKLGYVASGGGDGDKEKATTTDAPQPVESAVTVDEQTVNISATYRSLPVYTQCKSITFFGFQHAVTVDRDALRGTGLDHIVFHSMLSNDDEMKKIDLDRLALSWLASSSSTSTHRHMPPPFFQFVVNKLGKSNVVSSLVCMMGGPQISADVAGMRAEQRTTPESRQAKLDNFIRAKIAESKLRRPTEDEIFYKSSIASDIQVYTKNSNNGYNLVLYADISPIRYNGSEFDDIRSSRRAALSVETPLARGATDKPADFDSFVADEIIMRYHTQDTIKMRGMYETVVSQMPATLNVPVIPLNTAADVKTFSDAMCLVDGIRDRLVTFNFNIRDFIEAEANIAPSSTAQKIKEFDAYAKDRTVPTKK